MSGNTDARFPSPINDQSGSSESLQRGNTGMNGTDTYPAPLDMPTVGPGSQPQPGMPNANAGLGRPWTLQELNGRARVLTQSIVSGESIRQALAIQVNAQADQVTVQRLKTLNTDIALKKAALSKVTAVLNALKAQKGQIQEGSDAGDQALWTFQSGSSASSQNNSQPGLTALGQNPPQQQQIAIRENMGHTGMNSPSNLTNTYPPPLDKIRFDQSFRVYCVRKNLNIDLLQLQVDNIPIDLYQLHRNVMLELGVANVEQKGIWDVIGGRLGFVQFPGTETEPAKSSPGVAQQLAHIYKGLLAAFDQYYVSSVLSARLMQSATAYAYVPTSELRQCGVPEKIVAFIEANRVNLQRRYAERSRNFQNQFRRTIQNDAQGSGDQMNYLGEQLANSLHLEPATQQNSVASPAIQQQNALNPLQGNILPGNPQPQHSQQRTLQQGPSMQPMRPPKKQLERSRQFVQNFKRQFNTISLPSLPFVDVPVERRVEYLNLLDVVHTLCLRLEPKLAMYLVVSGKEDLIRRLTAIICTIVQQKSFEGARFIITLGMLQNVVKEIRRMTDEIATMMPNGLVGRRPQGLTSHSSSEVGGEVSATADGPGN